MALVQTDVDLSSRNTLRLASRAALYIDVSSSEDVEALAADSALAGVPRRVLGGGSNLVLPDVVDGLTLKCAIRGCRLVGEDEHAVYVSAGGGEVWHDFVQWTLAQGWGGLENLSLIPGEVGASPVQNIGAYGAEVKDTLFELTALNLQSGERRVFDRQACRFGYRDSVFKQEEAGRWLIAEVMFRLPKRPTLNTGYGDIERELESAGLSRTPQGVAQAVMNVRRRKLPDPAEIGNAGSFFKNPVVSAELYQSLQQAHADVVAYALPDGQYKLAAGWLIEQAGWKGKRLGEAGMFERQALVVVNHGAATRRGIADLTAAVQHDVAQRFGVQLDPEPVWW
ncbi:UDP-N-acetylmuramate dehydrogenase [Chitinibacteraceae bacterium HSL-7]